MSGCECGQSGAMGQSVGDAQDDALAVALRNEAKVSDFSAPWAVGLGTLGAEELDATLGAELAAVEVEDEARAMQELYEAATQGDGALSLEDVLAIAKANPGLKVTFSY